MNADVILGLQWGDEGKGKIVDFLTPEYSIIARFQGGPNAGHTLEFDGKKHVLHNIPSGIFRPEVINVIGNGVVIDPIIFAREVAGIKSKGVDIHKNLFVSKKAHLILPSHRILDAASEAAKGKTKIGSTLKGIGPTYMDKTGRNGLRVGDIITPNFREKYNALLDKHRQLLKMYDFSYDLAEFEKGWWEGIEVIAGFNLIDSEIFLNQKMDAGMNLLAEGAQGTLLDIDFGSYPYVTSSNTICAGACAGLGIGPKRVNEVLGVFKAYCTRVGSGPFPTELFDDMGERMRTVGHEFGSTTGRPRRCGWLDLVALRYAIMINGVTRLSVMKADVLSGIETIRVCTGYKVDRKVVDTMPFSLEVEVEPVYTDMKGWQEDITKVRKYSDLPQTFRDYLAFIEEQTRLPITIVSVGPEREATLFKG